MIIKTSSIVSIATILFSDMRSSAIASLRAISINWSSAWLTPTSVVSIRERVEFSRALLERLPKLKLIALVGRNSQAIDFKACTELGIPVATGKSNSPVAPAELTVALILAARRNIALEAERIEARRLAVYPFA